MPRHRDPYSPTVVYRTARAGLRLTRSVLRRYSDAWFAAAARRKIGDTSARFPRRRHRMMPVRWYHGTFALEGRRLRIPVARDCPPLQVRLDRDLPYPAAQVRSVTLLYDAGRLWADVTAEVPVTVYPPGAEPDPGRLAGVDLGIIHPYAVAGPDGQSLLVSGRPGQRGSRRWRHYRRRQRAMEARHARRVAQAQHEAARTVIGWAVARRIGTLADGDPRGVLGIHAGRRHNRRTRDWRVGHLIRVLRDKAEQAGITMVLTDERGTSSTCPACRARAPKPRGRVFCCPRCGQSGHRDLIAAANIAARTGGGTTSAIAVGVTHRRAGNHLPGVSLARRDPRRRPHHGDARGSPGRHLPGPTTATADRGVARPTARTS